MFSKKEGILSRLFKIISFLDKDQKHHNYKGIPDIVCTTKYEEYALSIKDWQKSEFFWVKEAVHYLIDILFLKINKFKLIFYKVAFYKIFFSFNLFLLLGIIETQAQQNVNYSLYANIIYRFTKYINWPDNEKSRDFVIGIIGNPPLYDEIKKFTANKMAGDQKIVVKIFSNSATSFDCQILFIGNEESRSLKKIATLTERASILLLSESKGLARKGSCINFIIVDEHLKLEINKTNIEDRHLEIASELLALGTIVK